MRLTILLTAVLAIVFGGMFWAVYSGLYNVAATERHTGFTLWALHTIMKNSVRERARDIEVPQELLAARTSAERGFRNYREMCVMCHGAPGVEPSEVGQGLTPEPPDLAKRVENWSAAELYWIVHHGIKMTGMPAFGPTHADEELWALVAFLQKLPSLTPEAYQAMERAAEDVPHRHGMQMSPPKH